MPQLDKFVKALSCEARRDVLAAVVWHDPISTIGITRCISVKTHLTSSLSLSSVLRHLKVLEEAELVRSEKNGTVRTWQFNTKVFEQCVRHVATLGGLPTVKGGT